MFEQTRDFTWRRSKVSIRYANDVPKQSTFRRRGKSDAIESVCSHCHLVHALNQRECD